MCEVNKKKLYTAYWLNPNLFARGSTSTLASTSSAVTSRSSLAPGGVSGVSSHSPGSAVSAVSRLSFGGAGGGGGGADQHQRSLSETDEHWREVLLIRSLVSLVLNHVNLVSLSSCQSGIIRVPFPSQNCHLKLISSAPKLLYTNEVRLSVFSNSSLWRGKKNRIEI